MEDAGWTTLPYHDNVPSFGDWGWILAWKKGSVPDLVIRERIEKLVFEKETRYLTKDVFRSAMVFGKGSLEGVSHEVNTLMRPILLEYYTRDGWKVE